MKRRCFIAPRTASAGLVFAAVLFTAACLGTAARINPPAPSVPPAWTQPDAAAAGEKAAAAAPQTTAAAAGDLAKWWRRFGDARLTAFIEEAFGANYDLQTAQARLRQSRALRGVAAGALWPQVTASASYSRLYSTVATAVAPQGHDLFQAGFDAVWEADIFGGLRQSLAAAGANALAAEENVHNVQVSLAAEVALLYAQIRGTQQRIAIAKSNLEAQQRTLEIARKRKSVGFVSALDVANAEAQAATTLSQIPLLEKSARQSIYSLSVLLARPPADLLGELTEAHPLPALPAQIPAGSPPDLLRRRPDIRQAEALFRAAIAQVGAAEAELFPQVSIGGSLGWQSTLVKNWFSQISLSWAVGPSVSWTAFAGGSRAANVRAQEAARDQAVIAYRQTILAALQDVENALVSFGKDQESRKALDTAAVASRRASELASQLYIQGAAEFINVLDAERTQYASEDALVQADIGLFLDIIALYKSLGGGWEAGQ